MIIAVDNDIPRLQRAEKLKYNLKAAKSVKIWNPFGGEPVLQKKCKDVSDWLASPNRKEKIPADIQKEIEKIVEDLPTEEIGEKPKPNDTFRNDYRLTEKGLYHITHEKDNDLNTLKECETWVCSPIRLECWMWDKESGNWGRF